MVRLLFMVLLLVVALEMQADGEAAHGLRIITPVAPPTDSVILTSPTAKDVTIRVESLKDYKALAARGWYPATTFERSREIPFWLCIETIRQIDQAKRAQNSHIRASFKKTVLDDLPWELVPNLLGEELPTIAAAKEQGLAWSQAYPNSRITEQSQTELSFTCNGFEVLLRILAAGDFDSEGLEDLLILHHTMASHGTYRAASLGLLSRVQPNGRLRWSRADQATPTGE